MIADKTVCKINKSVLSLTFLSPEFIDTVADIVFVIFVNTYP